LPKRYKELFDSNHLIKNFKFNSTFKSSDNIGNDELNEEGNDYAVEITVKPQKKNVSDENTIMNLYHKFMTLKFNNKPLENFDKKKVYLGSDGPIKGAYFEIGSDWKIQPIIYLGDIDFDENNIPNFEQIKVKCNEILSCVKQEIYP
jgi:hypothetical protein